MRRVRVAPGTWRMLLVTGRGFFTAPEPFRVGERIIVRPFGPTGEAAAEVIGIED